MTATPSQGAPDQQKGTGAETALDKVFAGAIPLGTIAVVGLSWLLGVLGVGSPKMEVVTAAAHDTVAGHWVINGRTILRSDGRPVQARVWAIAVDSGGNRYSPMDTVADRQGRFVLPAIPDRLTTDKGRPITDVTVYAAGLPPGDSTKRIRGEESIRLAKFGRVRWVEASPAGVLALVSIGVTFFLTITVGLIQPRSAGARRGKYFSLVVLSFLFTVTMVALIALALRNVNASASTGDVMSLGFANIYHGSYVKDVQPEWLFSLTAPQTGEANSVTVGFGVPLWLLLVSVLGSGLFTIALLVKHVKEPLDYVDDAAVRARVEELVRHQFYLVFSPLGAVLVYQLMVAAGLASVQVTVALAIFAAGASVNAVLDRALRAVQSVLTDDSASGDQTGGMGKKAQKTARKVDTELTDVEATLIRRTTVDLKALRPQIGDQASFDKLVAALEASTRQNESIAAFKDRFAGLGKGVVAVAKQVAALLPS